MMEINRMKLLQNLRTSMVGADKGEFQGNTFSFREGYVHTFKDILALSVYLGPEYEGLNGSIRAAEFYSLLSKYTEDVVNVEVVESGIEVSCGKSRAVFAFQEDSVLAQVQKMDVSNLAWSPLAEDFTAALAFCLLGSKGYVLEGVRVRGRVAVSVDSKRVNYFEMKSEVGDFLIEEKVASELLKFDGLVEVAHSPARVFFRLNDGTIVSGRKVINENYPLEKVLDTIGKMGQEESDPSGVLPQTFKQMIGRADIFSIEYGGMELLRITFSEDCIHCEAQRSVGRYQERVDWEEPPKGLKEPVRVVLETASTVYALERSKTFYIKDVGGNRRLVFRGENCMCYLAAYDIEDDDR